MDVIALLMASINMPAALLGVAATQAVSFFIPAQVPDDGAGKFSTTAGGWSSRLVPFVAPVIATLATFVMEWDAQFLAYDAVRGILSGFASEFLLRVYYKTIKGL